MRQLAKWVSLIMVFQLSFCVQAAERDYEQSAPPPNKVIGWVEKALLLPGDLVMNAKMDTGALTSSLDAKNLTSFQRDGEDWVRFDVHAEDEQGQTKSQHFERAVTRVVTLRGAGGTDERPVVKMQLCIGNQGGDMKYPLLIGRRTIGHLGFIDVTRQFTVDPKCPSE